MQKFEEIIDKAWEDREQINKNSDQNSYGFMVLSKTLFIVGILIILLAFMAEVLEIIVLVVGLLILVISGMIYLYLRKRIQLKKQMLLKKRIK